MHPSDVKIGQKEYRSYELVRFIKEGKLKLEEKRSWDDKNMSMSIESILLGLTMTPIYIDASNPESWFVLDGRKRLQSLNNFINGEFPLTALDFFPDFNGSYFEDLPYSLQDKLEEAIFTIYSINQGVPNRVRLNLVLRIVPDLKSALSWEFKESLMENSLKEELKFWLHSSEYSFIENRIKVKTTYRILLDYLRLYLIKNKKTAINLQTNIEHIIFLLNEKGIHDQENWNLGTIRLEKVFKGVNSFRAYHLNITTIPLLFFYFGNCLNDKQFEKLENNKEQFLDNWKDFYFDEGKNLFKRVNVENIYKKLENLI